MTQYRLVFEGTRVARIKSLDDPGPAPLAWFRVVYADASNRVDTVQIYGHADAISDRPRLASCATIAAAVAYCDQLHPGTRAGFYDWTGESTETSADD